MTEILEFASQYPWISWSLFVFVCVPLVLALFGELFFWVAELDLPLRETLCFLGIWYFFHEKIPYIGPLCIAVYVAVALIFFRCKRKQKDTRCMEENGGKIL